MITNMEKSFEDIPEIYRGFPLKQDWQQSGLEALKAYEEDLVKLPVLEDGKIATKYAIELERTVMEQILPYIGVPCDNPIVAPVLPYEPGEEPQQEEIPEDGIISGDDDDMIDTTTEDEE